MDLLTLLDGFQSFELKTIRKLGLHFPMVISLLLNACLWAEYNLVLI